MYELWSERKKCEIILSSVITPAVTSMLLKFNSLDIKHMFYNLPLIMNKSFPDLSLTITLIESMLSTFANIYRLLHYFMMHYFNSIK